MTKIKTILVKENTYQGKTSKSYTVTLDDGTTGFINSKGADAFREGDEVTFTLEKKKSSAGKEYNQLTLTKAEAQQSAQQPSQPNKPSAPQSSSTLKAQTRAKVPFTAIEKVIDLVLGNKVPWEKIKESHQELCNILYDEIENRTFSE